MDVFNIFLGAISEESIKCSASFRSKDLELNKSTDENFGIPEKRMAYLYKFGTFNTLFFARCFSNFIENCIDKINVINQIHSAKVICSLSIGPGTDIIGLVCAFHEIGKTLSKQISYNIINKHTAWKSTVAALMTSLKHSSVPLLGKLNFLQCDILVTISPAAKAYLKDADVILMDHAFSSLKVQKNGFLTALREIIQVIKPGTLVIIVDTKTKLAYFNSFAAYGSFISSPTEIQLDNLQYSKKVTELYGEKPISSGKAHFGIWRKVFAVKDIKLNSTSLVTGVPASQKGNAKDMNSSYSSVVSKSLNIIIPAIKYKENTCLSKPSVDTIVNSEASVHSDLKVKGCDIASNPGLRQKVTAMDTELKYRSYSMQTDSNDCVKSPKENINSLIKSLDNLVSKIEVFVSSELVTKDVNTLPSKCCTPKSHCKSLCNRHCSCINFDHCCRSTNRHLCCNTDSKGSCNMHSNVLSYCHCMANRNTCSSNHASLQSSCEENGKSSSYQAKPHIVIPIQNASTEHFSQVLSLIMQEKPHFGDEH